MQILGINQDGYESGNASFVAGRDLPWLQEGSGDTVWESWDVSYRDVWVIGADGLPFGVYNLTSNNLGTPENYAEMKQLLLDAAAAAP